MLPLGLYTRGLARWEMVVHPPIDPQADGGGKIEALTAVMNQHLTEAIRRSPQECSLQSVSVSEGSSSRMEQPTNDRANDMAMTTIIGRCLSNPLIKT